MTIRARLNAVAVSVVLVVAVMLIGMGYRAQAASEARYVASVIAAKQLLWDQLVTRAQEKMSVHTKAVTRDSTALKALRKGQREVVVEQMTTTHNMLSAEGAIDRLQLFDTEGSYLAALPPGFDGMSGKSLVRLALDESKPVFGVNRDDDGSLQVITAFPLFARGKLRGVAIFSQGVQRLLDTFQQKDGSDVFVFDPRGELEVAAAKNSVKLKHLPISASEQGDLQVLESDGRYRVTVGVPIRNERGEVVASLVTSQDQTAFYRSQANTVLFSIVLVFLALVLSSGGLFWYFRKVFKPVEDAVACMVEVSEGNLKLDLPVVHRKDETGRLIMALNSMVDQLNHIIGKIGEVTSTLLSETGNLTDIASRGNQRMATQRSETDQVATATQQMSVTIQEVARNASAAAEAADKAFLQTSKGSQTVQQTFDAVNTLVSDVNAAGEVVNRLRTESENIGSVLDVIHGIAEQTNLLALNAAIEAARAGEQGRGFAVVADEVRNLASKTQQSTQDIQSMIEHLQQGSSEAVAVMAHGNESSEAMREQVSIANDAFQQIEQSVREISDMNNQIARASEEQSSVSEMISRSVTEIVSLAGQSEQAASETADAAKEISQTGLALGDLVKRFQV